MTVKELEDAGPGAKLIYTCGAGAPVKCNLYETGIILTPNIRRHYVKLLSLDGFDPDGAYSLKVFDNDYHRLSLDL